MARRFRQKANSFLAGELPVPVYINLWRLNSKHFTFGDKILVLAIFTIYSLIGLSNFKAVSLTRFVDSGSK